MTSPAKRASQASASSKILSLAGGAGDLLPSFLSQDLLEKSFPGYSIFQNFFSSWLKLDLSKVAALFVILGAASGVLQSVAPQIYRWWIRFFTASVSIRGNDRLNKEVLNWLGPNVLLKQGTRILTARSEVVQDDTWSSWRKKSESGSNFDHEHDRRIPIQYFPTYGTTWFFHDWHLFMIRRCPPAGMLINGQQPDEYSTAPEGEEPLVIMTLGRSIEPIKRFLDTCRTYADQQRETFITVRASKNKYSTDPWDTTILRPIRPIETVHFDESTKSEIVADIENYLKPTTRRFYTARGIPYRRGFLLHGPPGTGKTSLCLALAGYFNLELYQLHLPSIQEDNDLEKLFAALPPKCIVLLEDIDAVGMDRLGKKEKKRWYSGRDGCTLSGLLNALDGVASQEGRIMFMTSNHADKLDQALIRPGRVDRLIYLGNISQKSAELMFLRMYVHDGQFSTDQEYNHDNTPTTQTAAATAKETYIDEEELRRLAVTFGQRIPNDTFTPAQIQGFLLGKRDKPTKAVDEIETWVKDTIALKEAMEKKLKEAEAERKAKRRAKAKKLKAFYQSDEDSDNSYFDSASGDDDTETASSPDEDEDSSSSPSADEAEDESKVEIDDAELEAELEKMEKEEKAKAKKVDSGKTKGKKQDEEEKGGDDADDESSKENKKRKKGKRKSESSKSRSKKSRKEKGKSGRKDKKEKKAKNTSKKPEDTVTSEEATKAADDKAEETQPEKPAETNGHENGVAVGPENSVSLNSVNGVHEESSMSHSYTEETSDEHVSEIIKKLKAGGDAARPTAENGVEAEEE